jgi:hypothetical protein
MAESAREAAREDFVWNMHTDYSGVAREAFDGGYDAGVSEGLRQTVAKEEPARESAMTATSRNR